MCNTRKAFTMIELIFVIVIIGILAAVALPKMTATRDDAMVASIVANTKRIYADTESYYTAKGILNYLKAKTPEITSVPLYLMNNCTMKADMDRRVFVGSTLYLCDGAHGTALMRITTTNTSSEKQWINFEQLTSNSLLSKMLSANKTFQSFMKDSDGHTGRRYYIGGSKVIP